MISPSLALLASIAGILILLRLKVHPGFAIFAGSLVVSLLVLPLKSTPTLMLEALWNYQTLRLLVIIASALTLSRLMDEKGLLTRLASAMERVSPKLALHFVPAVIGLVPMPAGALVSATAARGLVTRLGLNPEQSTFINYWFRHIWENFLPVYPAVIATSVILSIPLSSVMATLSPMTGLSVIGGGIISYMVLRKIPGTRGKLSWDVVYEFGKGAWPILLIIAAVLLGLEAMIAFPLMLILLAWQQKTRWPELRKAFKNGLDWKIMFLLYAVMFYKTVIEDSGTAFSLFTDMQNIGFPTLVILFVLPFLISFAAGLSIAFVGVAFPLLVPFIVPEAGFNGPALFLAYVSGMVGMLLSPLHLCFVLSAAYFEASLARVYRYVLPPVLAILLIAIVVYWIAG